MRCTPIEDYCRPNPMFYGLGRRFKLRNHATCSCAIRDEVRNRVHRNLAHQILVLVQNTSHVRQQEQAARPEGRRKRPRGPRIGPPPRPAASAPADVSAFTL